MANRKLKMHLWVLGVMDGESMETKGRHSYCGDFWKIDLLSDPLRDSRGLLLRAQAGYPCAMA